MANTKSAAQRALELLAEIENDDAVNNAGNSTISPASPPKKAIPSNPNLFESKTDSRHISIELDKLSRDELVRGILLSEVLDKPLALRHRRRF